MASNQRGVGLLGYFGLSFGTTVGSAWIVVLGEWLGFAGPGGAVLGFAAGTVVMVAIGACYAELAGRMPQSGTDFVYALHAFGPRVAFLVGWFLCLYAIAVCAFEAIALAWMLGMLLPPISIGPAYVILGQEVTWGALLVGTIGACAIAALNIRGITASIRFQTSATLIFLLMTSALMVLAWIKGSTIHWEPMFASTRTSSWVLGAIWIFATSALFMSGFQSSLYAVEERAPGVSVRGATSSMLIGILFAGAFYCSMILAVSMAVPWELLVKSELPAVRAFSSLVPSAPIATIVLVAGCVSLSKTWNALVVMGSRLLAAQASHGVIPSRFGHTTARSGAPAVAIVFVTVVTLVLVPLGRGAIVPIVNTVAICLALSYVLAVVALLRVRRRSDQKPAYNIPGGMVVISLACGGASIMALAALLEPLTRTRGVPLEWIILLSWTAIGAWVWAAQRRRWSSSASQSIS